MSSDEFHDVAGWERFVTAQSRQFRAQLAGEMTNSTMLVAEALDSVSRAHAARARRKRVQGVSPEDA
jgi:hypothetical protein